MSSFLRTLSLIAFVPLVSSSILSAFGQGTTFTYQGRLTSGTNAANGSYDFQFSLRDTPAAGNPVSLTNTLTTSVTDGSFTVALDFGANSFTNGDRWLEIAVRTNGGGAFTTLAPRQKLAPTPYAIFAANAAMATTLSGPFAGNLAGGTNLNGASIQAGTVNSNALDAATREQLALAGTLPIGARVTNLTLVNPSADRLTLTGVTNIALVNTNVAKVLFAADTNSLEVSLAGIAAANGHYTFHSNYFGGAVMVAIFTNQNGMFGLNYDPACLDFCVNLTNSNGVLYYTNYEGEGTLPMALYAVGPGIGTAYASAGDITNYQTQFQALGGVVGGLDASQLTSGSVPLARLSGITSNQFDAGTSNQLFGPVIPPITNTTANVMLQGMLINDMNISKSVNLDKLSKFWNAVNAKAKPIKMIIISDLTDFPSDDTFKAAWTSLLGTNGGIGVGMEAYAGNIPGLIYTSYMPGVVFDTSYTVWPFGGHMGILTNGSISQWNGFGDGSLGGIDIRATKAVVIYLSETNAGTFLIRTNFNGGGWGTCSTVNAAAWGTNATSVTIPLAPGRYRLQIVGNTGRCRLIGAGLWDDTSPGAMFTRFDIGGLSLSNIASQPTNYWWPVFSAIDPTLVMINDTDAGEAYSDMSSFYFGRFEYMLTNCCPNADVVWLGNHHIDYNPPFFNFTNGAERYNTQAMTAALKYGQMYWDPDPTFGTNSTWMVSLGLLGPGGIHTTPAALPWLNRRLFDDLIKTKAYANQLGPAPVPVTSLGTNRPAAGQVLKYDGTNMYWADP
jgi:hypothetical protein